MSGRRSIPQALTRLPVRGVIVDDDHVHAEVSVVDHFGNVSLNLCRADLEAAGITFGDTVELRCNGRTRNVPFTATYGDVAHGRLTLCEDSFRAIMLAVNAGHASRELRVAHGRAGRDRPAAATGRPAGLAELTTIACEPSRRHGDRRLPLSRGPAGGEAVR